MGATRIQVADLFHLLAVKAHATLEAECLSTIAENNQALCQRPVFLKSIMELPRGEHYDL